MKGFKIFSIIFQSIQALLIIGFILTLLNWSWVNVNYIVIFVVATFFIFINIVTWISILND
jgi:hypothetical protein